MYWIINLIVGTITLTLIFWTCRLSWVTKQYEKVFEWYKTTLDRIMTDDMIESSIVALAIAKGITPEEFQKILDEVGKNESKAGSK